MKILAILPSTAFYGKERSNIEVYHLIKEKANMDVRILCNNKSCEKLKFYLSNFDVYPILIPSRKMRQFRYFAYLMELLFSNIQFAYVLFRLKPDALLLCTETTLYDFFIPLNLFRKKIIYRMGDAPCFPGLKMRFYNKFVWNILMNHKIDQVICISNYILKELEKSGRCNDKDIIIYNYPPKRICNIDEQYLYKLSKATIIFGYIGQIIEEKGIADLLSAFRKVWEIKKDVRLYIAGSLIYQQEYADELLHSYKYLVDNGTVSFLGEVEDIKCFFSHIDVLCVPSIKQEPLGNVLVEAKKYSRPCLIYPTGGMPELIRHCIDGYICSSATVNALEEGLLFFYNHKNDMDKYKDESRNSIKFKELDRFNFENKWLNVFCSLYK